MAKKKKPIRTKTESPFSKNLKSILEERRINQKTAADLAQVSTATMNGWLSNSSPADHLAVQRLCRALDCSFEWILTGEQAPSSKKENLSITEFFEIEDDPMLSGYFEIQARRLKKRK